MHVRSVVNALNVMHMSVLCVCMCVVSRPASAQRSFHEERRPSLLCFSVSFMTTSHGR